MANPGSGYSNLIEEPSVEIRRTTHPTYGAATYVSFRCARSSIVLFSATILLLRHRHRPIRRLLNRRKCPYRPIASTWATVIRSTVVSDGVTRARCTMVCCCSQSICLLSIAEEGERVGGVSRQQSILSGVPGIVQMGRPDGLGTFSGVVCPVALSMFSVLLFMRMGMIELSNTLNIKPPYRFRCRSSRYSTDDRHALTRLRHYHANGSFIVRYQHEWRH